ncbi:MAG: hypothetical protein ACI4BI_01360 [Anaerotardibacter sp.]
MVDRIIDPDNDAPVEDIDDVLKSVFNYVLNEAADKMDRGEELIPFTGLAIKENLFIETHDYETTEETYLRARREVEGARGATAYAFCYDGYIQTDDGMRDCIIAEGGLPGENQGYAFGYLYDEEGIDRSIVYIGPAPNFMENLKLELEMEVNTNPEPVDMREVEEAFGITDDDKE